jgi:hypothetical protein
MLPANIKTIIPDTVDVPVRGFNVPVSTKWAKTMLPGDDPKVAPPKAEESSSSDKPVSWFNLTKSLLGFVGAAAAKAAAPVPIAMGPATQLSEYGAFLNPLLGSSEPRINLMIQEHKNGLVSFKAFYNHITTTTEVENEDCKTVVTQSKGFCTLPPQKHETFFHPMDNPVKNEIDAHMNMFNQEWVGKDHYDWMLKFIGEHFYSEIQRHSSKE